MANYLIMKTLLQMEVTWVHPLRPSKWYVTPKEVKMKNISLRTVIQGGVSVKNFMCISELSFFLKSKKKEYLLLRKSLELYIEYCDFILGEY